MDHSVYNHLVSTYVPKKVTKYDAHKSSELRSVMRNIAKLTKESPLYLINLSDDKQTYALSVKEDAIGLQNAFSALLDTSSDSIFAQRKAVSSKPEQATVDISTEDYEKLPEEFTLQVEKLAKNQVNIGKEYYLTGRGPEEGLYRFQAIVDDASYDFQYNIGKNASHKDILQGLASFISKAKIGLKAEAEVKGDKIHMKIASEQTGAPGGKPMFELVDKSTPGSSAGIVSYYDLNHIASMPQSASFLLNGNEKKSLTNTFVLDKSLEVSLHGTGDSAAEIKYLPDSDKILSGVKSILDTYNSLVDSTMKYCSGSDQSPKILREIGNVLKPFASEMESCGITETSDGYLKMDAALASQAAIEGDMENLFGSKSAFSYKMMTKLNAIKLNPMDYVEKTMVSYPNFGKPAAGYSYITSLYSGMLFNSYC